MFDVIAALVLGFTYGIGPCTIACAPIVVPLIMSTAKDRKDGVILSLIFSVGRVISYMTLGFLSGLIGAQFGFFPNWILGITLIVIGIMLIFRLEKKCIYKTNVNITSPYLALSAGVIYGFGPCPPLIALLALAASAKSAIIGAAMGLVFGIGTIVSPIVVLGFFSGWFAKQKEFKAVVPYVGGGFLILIGLLYLFG